MINLDNKVTLITGSNDGIRAATALLFSSLGAQVAIFGRNQDKLDKVADDCLADSHHGFKPVMIKADFEKDEIVKRTLDETIAIYKKLDILVNNAGIVSLKKFGKPDYLADYSHEMQVNLRAVIHLTELALSYLADIVGIIVN